MKYLSFTQKVAIIGVNPYVIPPDAILRAIFMQAGKKKGAIPVKGRVNGKEYIQTLVKYAGAWRLYINGIMRKAAGIGVGDVVDVEIVYDDRPRIEPMHPKFKEALGKNPNAQKAFEKFPPSRQKEINRYLNTMKTQESLLRNIDKVIRHLVGEKTAEYFVIMSYKK